MQIDSLSVANGKLGLAFCPGTSRNGRAGDMAADVSAIVDWNADAVISLIEPAEMKALGVDPLGPAIRAAGIAWFHLPIADMSAPDRNAEQNWRKISPVLHGIVESGGRILVHCRAGLGRTGTIVALILIERGMSASDAIAKVRAIRPGAIETRPQENWLRGQGAPDDENSRMRRASLLAGAMGDSLGAEIEFWSLSRIRQAFPDGLHDLPPHHGRQGAITDDTQMTLFTAEGLIRAAVRQAGKGICDWPGVVHHALLRWMITQGERPKPGVDDTGLVADARLRVRRAPGNTCLGALSRSEALGQPAVNDSKGCGTIMRVAPIALAIPREDVATMAVKTSALTHGHETGQLAAAIWAEMLADVAGGMSLERAVRNVGTLMQIADSASETAHAIDMALAAPRDGRAETVESLGAGWTADEALAIAIYACLVAEDLEHGLRVAVTHGGDSDSTGAIAGNMLGLMFPDQVLAHRWADRIECADLITRLATDLGCRDHRELAGMHRTYPGW